MATAGAADVDLFIVGDLFINREDPPSIFRHTREFLQRADLLFGNLECPLVGGGERTASPKPAYLKADPSSITGLQAAGFHAVSLAGNHSMDYGAPGLLSTIGILEEAGIGYCGGGRNETEARRPLILSRKNQRIAFLNYSSVYSPDFPAGPDRPGIAVISVATAYQPHPRAPEVPGIPPLVRTWPDATDLASMSADITGARSQADLVVAAFHWGMSDNNGVLIEYQRTLGRAAIDAGADLVVGSHAHMLQGIEFYKGKAIFYGLGDFAFDLWLPFFGEETVVLCCRVHEGKITRLAVRPALLNQQLEPEFVGPDRWGSCLDQLLAPSSSLDARLVPDGEELLVMGPPDV